MYPRTSYRFLAVLHKHAFTHPHRQTHLISFENKFTNIVSMIERESVREMERVGVCFVHIVCVSLNTLPMCECVNYVNIIVFSNLL